MTTISTVSSDRARRTEILETAAAVFESSGLRVSLKEIADACGILPGSLYHHFDSKEAMIVELVRRYRDDLDRVGNQALRTAHKDDARSVEDRIVQLGQAIAACGVQHRAALLLTLYDPPTVLGDELAKLANQAPTAVESAMLELVRQARAAGSIRSGIDLALLSDRLCQSMIHVAVGVSHMTRGAEHVPELRLRILLHGVAQRTPSNTVLDRSDAISSAEEVIATWVDDSEEDLGRTAHLKAMARKEFGRRGYEATTMRDIAAAAGLSTGTVYRAFRSKDDLLVSIMRSYSEKAKAAWDAALDAKSTPLEKLDALTWINIHLVDRFSDELRIQLAWLRQSPPTTPNLGQLFTWHLRRIEALLAEGAKSGEIRVDGPNADIRARCLLETITSPPSVVRAGIQAAQALARDTVLRGALTRTTG